MKAALLSLLAFGITWVTASAQTTPIFNQKMTDYFTYDPSRTGLSGGSLIFTNQQLATGLDNAPQTNFIGGHTRMFFDQAGFGGSVYMQESGIIKTYRISAGAAYHTRLNSELGLSFGIAPEITRGELSLQDIFVLDADDPVIQNYGARSDFDVSSGVSLRHSFYHVGLVFNRLISLTGSSDSDRAFPGHLSGYVQGKLPARSNLDLFEPMLFVNRMQDGTTQFDLGGFYTYEHLIFLGAFYRTQSSAAFSLGYNVKNRLVLGYSYQVPLTSDLSFLGSSSEITIRFNFNKQYFETYNPRPNTDTISPLKKGN